MAGRKDIESSTEAGGSKRTAGLSLFCLVMVSAVLLTIDVDQSFAMTLYRGREEDK
jgi:hypothetical protein